MELARTRKHLSLRPLSPRPYNHGHRRLLHPVPALVHPAAPVLNIPSALDAVSNTGQGALVTVLSILLASFSASSVLQKIRHPGHAKSAERRRYGILEKRNGGGKLLPGYDTGSRERRLPELNKIEAEATHTSFTAAMADANGNVDRNRLFCISRILEPGFVMA